MMEEGEAEHPVLPKKSRSANFFRDEELSLVEIIKNNNFGPILEDHKKDSATVKQKQDAWKLIYQQWTALPHVSKRTLEQIQFKWKNVVKLAKTEDASRKRKMKETGGGEPPLEPDQMLMNVKKSLSHKFSEIPNPFDGDSANSCQIVAEGSKMKSVEAEITQPEPPLSESPGPSKLVAIPRQDKKHMCKAKSTAEKVAKGVKSLVTQRAKNEHELKMRLIRLQIDLTNMEKMKKEELFNLKIEAAKLDLAKAQRAFGDQFPTNSNANET